MSDEEQIRRSTPRPRRALDDGLSDPTEDIKPVTGPRYATDSTRYRSPYSAPRAATTPSVKQNHHANRVRENDRKFRLSLTRTTAGTFIPGLGLLKTKAHWLGVLLLAIIVLFAVAVIIFVPDNFYNLLASIVDSRMLFTIGLVIAVVAVLWVALIAGTYLVSRPSLLRHRQRLTGSIVVAVLSFIISAPLAVVSGYAFETSRLSGQVFDNNKVSQTRPEGIDPWKGKDRINILLLGGDSGESRDEALGIRTDTIMFASIDLKSGNTVIVQLPRNLQNPVFPKGSKLADVYPYGFDDGGMSFLSSVWHDVPLEHPELFKDTDYPNADALKWAVEGVTGQRMDYFVMINIDGLVQLVDAIGGVTVNVNYPIAKGGSVDKMNCGTNGWIPEGPDQHLNGEDAMWYARSRCNSPAGDFSRMQRQSCLINAIIKQANPAQLSTRYEQIVKAAGNMMETDIPQEHLDAIVKLAGKVKGAELSRLSFVYDGLNGFDPSSADFDGMRQRVSEELAKSAGSPAPSITSPADSAAPIEAPNASESPAKSAIQPNEALPTDTQSSEPQFGSTQQTTPGMSSATGTGEPKIEGQQVADVCAYRHEEPAWVDPSVPVYTPPASTEPHR